MIIHIYTHTHIDTHRYRYNLQAAGLTSSSTFPRRDDVRAVSLEGLWQGVAEGGKTSLEKSYTEQQNRTSDRPLLPTLPLPLSKCPSVDLPLLTSYSLERRRNSGAQAFASQDKGQIKDPVPDSQEAARLFFPSQTPYTQITQCIYKIITCSPSRGISVCQGQTLVRLASTLISFLSLSLLFPQEMLQRQGRIEAF